MFKRNEDENKGFGDGLQDNGAEADVLKYPLRRKSRQEQKATPKRKQNIKNLKGCLFIKPQCSLSPHRGDTCADSNPQNLK